MNRSSARPDEWLLATMTLASFLLPACGDTSNDALSDGDAGAHEVDSHSGDVENEDVRAAPIDRPIGERVQTLAEWQLFEDPLVEQIPRADVVPYTVVAPLWADHAEKGRFIVLPEGESVTIDDGGELVFPEGTILVKTFYALDDRRDPEGSARIIETRLLIRLDDEWKYETYVWDDDQTGAERVSTGRRINLDVVDESGTASTQEYIVPNLDQCASCHDQDDVGSTLGWSAIQLDLDVDVEGVSMSQLQYLRERGVLNDASAPLGGAGVLHDPFGSAALNDRARSYLHGNCSHCHQPGGGAFRSGLNLRVDNDDLFTLGVCKGPVAAGSGTGGFNYGIVPGHPEESIVIHRMRSTDPEVKMPELPNRIPDTRGVELVEEWIAAMEERDCD